MKSVVVKTTWHKRNIPVGGVEIIILSRLSKGTSVAKPWLMRLVRVGRGTAKLTPKDVNEGSSGQEEDERQPAHAYRRHMDLQDMKSRGHFGCLDGVINHLREGCLIFHTFSI